MNIGVTSEPNDEIRRPFQPGSNFELARQQPSNSPVGQRGGGACVAASGPGPALGPLASGSAGFGGGRPTLPLGLAELAPASIGPRLAESGVVIDPICVGTVPLGGDLSANRLAGCGRGGGGRLRRPRRPPPAKRPAAAARRELRPPSGAQHRRVGATFDTAARAG